MTGNISKDAGHAANTLRGTNAAQAPFLSADASGAAAAVTLQPGTGERLVVTDLLVSVDTDMVVTFTDESSAVQAKLYLAANSTVNALLRCQMRLLRKNSALQVQTSASGNISVLAGYYFEPEGRI